MTERLFIFDLDGTLCQEGEKIDDEMIELLNLLNYDYRFMVISSSSLDQIKQQLGGCVYFFDLIMAENGVMTYKSNGELVCEDDIRDYWNDRQLSDIVSSILYWVSQCQELPVKTGKFLDLRRGLIYFTPIGKDSSKKDQEKFIEMDARGEFRSRIIHQLRCYRPLSGLEMSLDGELGICISPVGWNKSYLLEVLEGSGMEGSGMEGSGIEGKYSEIFYFGDQMRIGGCDEPVRDLKDVKCIPVQNPIHTQYFLNTFKSKDYLTIDKSLIGRREEDDSDSELGLIPRCLSDDS